MNEQVSKEFFIKIHSICVMNSAMDYKEALGVAIQKGYIKQSREEQIREELDEGFSYTIRKKQIDDFEKVISYVNLQKELIQILDKKLEGIKI